MPVTLTLNVNNATNLITVHTAGRHSPEFDKQAHQTGREAQPRQASTPTREAKRVSCFPLETMQMFHGDDVIRP